MVSECCIAVLSNDFFEVRGLRAIRRFKGAVWEVMEVSEVKRTETGVL